MNKHLPHSVYLIHGWAANGHVFADLRPLLPTNWQVRAPDLPGHGAGQLNGAFDIMAAADTLAAEMPDNSDIVGWSLGGLVALYIAIRHPHKVRRLCLTSSFAKFLATTDYPQGLNRSALDKMITLFEQDYPKYMRQFLQLQLLNTPDSEEIIASVLPDMVKNGAPAALKAALDALALADARPFLRQIRQPVLLVYPAAHGRIPGTTPAVCRIADYRKSGTRPLPQPCRRIFRPIETLLRLNIFQTAWPPIIRTI